jgi:hypothetical protein
MTTHSSSRRGPAARLGTTGAVLLGACLGAAGGLAGTALILRSLEAGILGAAVGAVVAMVGALARAERADS